MYEGEKPQISSEGKNPPDSNVGGDHFEIELTDEELQRLMAEQGNKDQAGFGSPEKFIAAAVADEVKVIIEQNASSLHVGQSEMVLKEIPGHESAYHVGYSQIGYVIVRVENGELKVTVPPSYGHLTELINRGAHHVFESDGKVGPKGV